MQSRWPSIVVTFTVIGAVIAAVAALIACRPSAIHRALIVARLMAILFVRCRRFGCIVRLAEPRLPRITAATVFGAIRLWQRIGTRVGWCHRHFVFIQKFHIYIAIVFFGRFAAIVEEIFA